MISFATDIGALTSHTAILARSLKAPAVVELRDISRKVKAGETLIVDGTGGVVIASPSRATLREYTHVKDGAAGHRGAPRQS